VERFGEFIVVCVCVLLTFAFMASLSVELVFCRFFSLVDVYCFMLYYMLLKFSLVYLTVLILICVGDFDILRGFSAFLLHGLVLSFVHLVKLFELFWLVCLVSGDLMYLSSKHYCR